MCDNETEGGGVGEGGGEGMLWLATPIKRISPFRYRRREGVYCHLCVFDGQRLRGLAKHSSEGK